MDFAPWFAFTGRAFLSADAEELRALTRELRRSDFPEGPFPQMLASMEDALKDDSGRLEKEYVRLFLDPAGAPCPPWQSAYGEERQLMGPAHRSALAWYRAAGVEPRRVAEPADHVGLLLAFFSHLLGSEGDIEIRNAFAFEHLAWIPPFCGRVGQETRHDFYRLLSDMTRSLIEQAGTPAKAA